MATKTTTADPKLGDLRIDPVRSFFLRDEVEIVYQVYAGDGVWNDVADQVQAKHDYENQEFNQRIAKAQQEAGLEPVGGTSLDGGSLRYPSDIAVTDKSHYCLLYTSPSPRDRQKSRMPSSA